MLIFAVVIKADTSESNPTLLGREKLTCFAWMP
jgi:hypothetical protein